MDFQVIFKDSFLTDLERIVKQLAIHNPDAARSLGELIIRNAENLGFFPERHPKVHRCPSVRRFIVKKHFKVFYRVIFNPRRVEVLRCWDGRRESDPIL